MKNTLCALFLTVGLCLVISNNVRALNIDEAKCYTPNQFTSANAIQNILSNYRTSIYTQSIEGIYVICFNQNSAFQTPISFQVSASESAPLIIYGLNVSTANTDSSALLNISGSNVTLQNSILSGPADGNGTGAAIQVYGTNITIKNSTISNFAEGIRVANGASVTLENNIFETIGVFPPEQHHHTA